MLSKSCGCKRGGRKGALGTQAPTAIPQDRNLRWALDFVADTLVSGRRFRILTLVDDFTRECLGWSWTPRSPACVSLANSIGYIRPGWPKYLTKAELRDRAIDELKISKNAFDFAWIEVIEETGCSEWYEPLRMRNTASKRS